MASEFNPLEQWLGIPAAEQPVSYYRLLGVAEFETDRAVIDRAAQARIAQLKAIDPGPHRANLKNLLKTVAAVGELLLDAKKKEAYDAGLRQKLSAAVSGDAASAAPNCVPQSAADDAKASAKGKIKNLNEYLIVKRLGVGGSGRVYKADDQRKGRPVALKIVPSQAIKNGEAADRFKRVVQAAAQLSHPNIVALFGAEEDQSVHYFVMEYIDGPDLAMLSAERGPIELPVALEYIIQVANGLNYAHKKGVFHRDLMPSNLLVDRQGTVKILGAGLSKFFQMLSGVNSDGPADVATLIASGQFQGPIDYMSPEQAEDLRRGDARSDIYSLGCTFYQLLTAELPFPEDTVPKKLLAHRIKPVPSLCQRRAEISGQLDEVVRRMMAKNATERYESMSDVIKALESCRSQQVAAGSTTPALAAPAKIATQGSNLLDLVDEAVASANSAANAISSTPTVSLPSAATIAPETRSMPARNHNIFKPLVNFVQRNSRAWTAIAVGMLIAILSAYGIRAFLDQEVSQESRPLSASEPADRPPKANPLPAPTQTPPMIIQASAEQPVKSKVMEPAAPAPIVKPDLTESAAPKSIVPLQTAPVIISGPPPGDAKPSEQPSISPIEMAAESPATITARSMRKKVKLFAPYPENGDGANSDRISVQGAVTELAKQVGLAYDSDKSQSNVGELTQRWVRPDIRNKRCDVALKNILNPLGLTYDVENQELVLKRK